MKNFEFKIDEHQSRWAFSAIRERKDVISLWMRAIKVMLVNAPPADEQVAASIVLRVSQMSRLFFVSENKIFSVSFPFFVRESEGGLQFYSVNYPNVDHRATSLILSLLDSPLLMSNDPLHFVEPVCEAFVDDTDVWALFRDLLIVEDGYLRYDFDPERHNGHQHPLNHVDVFYSNASTFKLGLTVNSSLDHLADVLDLATDCHYLRSAGA